MSNGISLICLEPAQSEDTLVKSLDILIEITVDPPIHRKISKLANTKVEGGFEMYMDGFEKGFVGQADCSKMNEDHADLSKEAYSYFTDV